MKVFGNEMGWRAAALVIAARRLDKDIWSCEGHRLSRKREPRFPTPRFFPAKGLRELLNLIEKEELLGW